MRDLIRLNDLAIDRANAIRELFNQAGVLQNNPEFAAITEEEIIAACIFFTDLIMRNSTLMAIPQVLVTLNSATMMANETNPMGEVLREFARNLIRKNGDGPEE